MAKPLIRQGGMTVEANAGDLRAGNVVPASNATVGAGVLTAAQIASGCILRTAAGGAVTDTTDTAAAILAAMPDLAVGESFTCYYSNQNAAILTLAGGVGVTASGTLATAANTMKVLLFTKTSATTMTMVAL